MLVSLPLLALLAGAPPGPTPTPCTPPSMSAKALSLMRPILAEFLRLHAAQLKGSESIQQAEQRMSAFEERFYPLLNTPGPAASEAIAALMCFYVGEHPAAELLCEAATRGAQIAPFLKRFRYCPPVTGLEPIDPSITSIPNLREEALDLIAAKKPGPCN